MNREQQVQGIAFNALTRKLGEVGGWLTLSDREACAAAVVAGVRDEIAAGERKAFRYVLTDHYLLNIECDHEGKRDRPWCACSLVDLGWHPNVGAAVQAWIDHVLTQTGGPP